MGLHLGKVPDVCRDVIDLAQKKWDVAPAIVFAILLVGIGYSLLRLTSVALLFMNDARMPAGAYIAALPGADACAPAGP